MFKILSKYIYLFIPIIILGAVIGAKSAKLLPSGYSQSQLFFLASPQESASQNNYYSPFFSQENARNFTDTAAAIIRDEQFLNEVSADHPSVAVQKVAPQLIRITVTSPGANLAQILDQIPQIYNQKITLLSEGSAATIKAVSPATTPVYFALSGPILAAVGAILGLLFSLIVIGLKVYLKL